jgi:hypothetical protein
MAVRLRALGARGRRCSYCTPERCCVSRLLSIGTAMAVAIAASCLVLAPSAGAKALKVSNPPAVSSIAWGPCTESDLVQLGAQCGMLSVPLN